MNRALVLTLAILVAAACSEAVRQQGSLVHSIDIDCDGVEEPVYMERVENDFIVSILASSSNKESTLRFGLAQPSRQDALCGKTPVFASQNADAEAQKMLFDEIPEGYKSGPQCFDLTISDGECDPITVFYNHKTQALNWWRL